MALNKTCDSLLFKNDILSSLMHINLMFFKIYICFLLMKHILISDIYIYIHLRNPWVSNDVSTPNPWVFGGEKLDQQRWGQFYVHHPYTHIWLIFMVNVGKYTSPMDPMGVEEIESVITLMLLMATRNSENSPVEVKVGSWNLPLFPRVWDTSKRWLGMGFLKHQQCLINPSQVERDFSWWFYRRHLSL